MSVVLVLLTAVLSACSSKAMQQTDPLGTIRELTFLEAPQAAIDLTESGTTFLAKFATSSALNSKRSFEADYHGEMRMTVYANKKIECRWWAEGREESIGFFESFSTLCTGKLQRNGTFEFQGAYMLGSDTEETFTIYGNVTNTAIYGTLLLDGILGNAATLLGPSDVFDAQKGLVFEATTP